MTVPRDTVVQLFYTSKGKDFSEKYSIHQSVKKGTNLIHIYFWAKPNEIVSLRFDPGTFIGKYTFNDILEIK